MKKTMLFLVMLVYVLLINAQQWIGFDNNFVQAPPQITVVSSDGLNTTMNVEITGYMHEIISVDGYNYDDYSVLGYGTTTEEGKPALPKLSVLLGIPVTSDIEVSDSYYSSYTADQLLVHTEDIPNGRHLQFTGNYWGYRGNNTFPILPPSSRFIPALINPSIGETGYDLSPVWGPTVNVTYSYSNDEQTYYSALNEVSLGNIDNAIDLFKQVVQNYPNSNYSVLSSKNLFKLVLDKAELKEFLVEEPNLYVNNPVHKDIDYLINHCDIELGNLQEASTWCENKINNPESEFDSLLAVIDLEYINLCIENESDSTKTNNLQLIHKRREKYVSFIDNKIDQLINISNISMIDENQIDIAPITTRLYKNYPNPFNPETTISFDLPQRGKVELVVYNLKGQKVKSLINEEMDMGVHKIIWNGTNNQGKEVASGVYYYCLSCGNYTKTNKMVLMK